MGPGVSVRRVGDRKQRHLFPRPCKKTRYSDHVVFQVSDHRHTVRTPPPVTGGSLARPAAAEARRQPGAAEFGVTCSVIAHLHDFRQALRQSRTTAVLVTATCRRDWHRQRSAPSRRRGPDRGSAANGSRAGPAPETVRRPGHRDAGAIESTAGHGRKIATGAGNPRGAGPSLRRRRDRPFRVSDFGPGGRPRARPS